MTTAVSALESYAPIVKVWTEQSKYEAMWEHPEYRAVAPGEGIAQLFLSQARPKAGSTVIDFGAGTGRGALMLAIMGNVKVKMLDFAGNCLDPEVKDALTTQAHVLDFTKHDLIEPIPFSAEYGYCTDVMEHIPKCQVDKVILNVLKSAQHVFFQIACEDDVCGALIGLPLHLSVHPYEWWLKKLQEYDVMVHWSQDFTSHCCFYVSAWQTGEAIAKSGVLNTEEEEILANVKANIAGDWQEFMPQPVSDAEVMILGGGPSMKAELETIKKLRSEGVKLVTLNGAYNWAIENGLTPSAQIMVDAREFNKRFTKPVIDDCKYYIASQCNPAVFEGLPKSRTAIWHTGAEYTREVLKEKMEGCYFIPGGNTVLLRALPMLHLIGYRKFHLFGCDSCIADDAHHAYAQPENDTAMVVSTIVGGRVFQCHPWMIAQCSEFMEIVKVLGDEIQLEIYGDGLLHWVLQHGYNLAIEEEAKA